jgi:leader peptidase (prepilin peptidase) / N-methyltransferase
MPVAAVFASSPALLVGSCLLLGLIVGSFLNVVIHRVPIIMERQWREQCAELEQSDLTATIPAAAPAKERYNLIVPRSACPACKAPIAARHNIPVLSYLLLHGRCANCGAPISLRYPIVEALTGILSAAVAWKLGFGWPTLAGLVLTWFLVALAFIDIDHKLLPDSLTLPLLWLGLFLSLFAPAPGAAPLPVDMRSSIIGAIAGYVCLWSVYHLFRVLTAKEGMGYGDFKLLAAIGAWLGWRMLLPTVLIAAAVGAVVGIALLASRGQSRSTPIAFGPFLAAAGWLMLMFGRELVTGYLGLFAH